MRKCSCEITEYYENGGCHACDSSCGDCYGGSPGQCTQCGGSARYNGSHCITCTTNCLACDGTAFNECKYCSSAAIFLLDGMCVSTCDAPLIQINSRTCASPCQSDQFIAPDRQCMSACDSPLQSSILYTKKFCNSPCPNPSGSILQPDNQCLTTCDYPLELKLYGPFQVCKYPCAVGDILYYNGDCLPYSFCVTPLVKQPYGVFEVCELPCPDTNFVYWNNTCQLACPNPLRTKVINNQNICEPPMCGAQECEICLTDADCPFPYYCAKKIGVCQLSTISYTLISEVVKNIQNGKIIRVEVIPKSGIPEGDVDMLLANVVSLDVNEDYQISIKKISKGIFLVTFEILRSLEINQISIHFNYLFESLNLESDLYFPRPTYISQSLQEAAEVIQAGSYVSFGILAVGTIGFIMSGGLSALWSFLPENQYSYYLLFLNINYPHHAKMYLRSLSNYNVLFDPTEPEDEDLIDEDLMKKLPARFIDEEYSPDFIENAGQVVLMILVITAILLLVGLVFKYVSIARRSYLAHRVLKTVRRIFKWNGIVRQLLAYSLPTALASFIELHVSLFGKEAFLLTLLLSIATLVVLCSGFNKTLHIIKSIPTDRYERLIYTERFGTLWDGLDLENSGTKTKYYFWIIAVRGVLLAYLSVFFELYPYAQIIILISYQIFVILLFFKKIKIDSIFEERFLNYVTFLDEICILLVKLIIFGFLIFDSAIKTDEQIIIIGWTIIAPGITTQVVQTLYSLWIQIKAFKETVNKIKEFIKKLCNKTKKKTKIRRIYSRKISTIRNF